MTKMTKSGKSTKTASKTRSKASRKSKAVSNVKTEKKPKDDTKSKIKNKQQEDNRIRATKTKRKENLLKLISHMNKLANDAVDREITKRFKTIVDTLEKDITKLNLKTILSDSKNVDLYSFDESIQPYIKHYLFMFKRNSKNK